MCLLISMCDFDQNDQNNKKINLVNLTSFGDHDMLLVWKYLLCLKDQIMAIILDKNSQNVSSYIMSHISQPTLVICENNL